MEPLDQMLNILRSFRKINRTFYHYMLKDAETVGLTGPQLLVLNVLSKKENIGLGELATRLQMTNSTLSGVVERLVQANLVTRERSNQDRRAIVVRLTEEGRKKLEIPYSSDSFLYKKMMEVLELPEEDIQNLLRIHGDILNKINAGEDGMND